MNWIVLGAVAISLGVAGCSPLTFEEPRAPRNPGPAENPELVAAAGVAVPLPGPETALETIEEGKLRYFPYRSDVFALLSSERAFDRSQLAERLISEGGFAMYYEPPAEEAEPPPPTRAPVPQWRLAGVLLSNGVVALAEIPTQTGTRYFDLRPGTIITVGETQWQVVSISEERAIVKRLGPGPEQYEEIRLTEGFGRLGGGNQGGGGSGPARPGTSGAGGGGGSSQAGQAAED
ncbi:MAG: hypothetical protein KF812_09210 [Fimbriimonadaceae bacterium]|nr:hypothetical protein [Fimbriimonadaceae bacterium]